MAYSQNQRKIFNNSTANSFKVENPAMKEALAPLVKKKTPRWTMSEKRSLKNLFLAGKSDEQIASVLPDRSTHGVHLQRCKMGLRKNAKHTRNRAIKTPVQIMEVKTPAGALTAMQNDLAAMQVVLNALGYKIEITKA